MRDGIFIVDGDGHVMDFPHRRYQKYLPEQYRRRDAFFPGATGTGARPRTATWGEIPTRPRRCWPIWGKRGSREFPSHRRAMVSGVSGPPAGAV